MVRCATYILLTSFVFTQDYRIMGTGLELDELDDFLVIINDFDEFSNSMGLDKNYFETEINLLLDKNNTPSATTLTQNFLFVKIEIVNLYPSSKIENQFFASISISFNRSIGYDAIARKYSKVGKVWHTDTVYVPIRINVEIFKKDIMEEVKKKINQFSSSLIEANNKI